MKSKIWNPSDFSQATADWKSDTGTVISITSPAFETRITFSEIEIIFYPFYDLSFLLSSIIQSHFILFVKSTRRQSLDYFFVGYLQKKRQGNKHNKRNKHNSQ